MSLQSSGAISLLQIQNEFKSTDENIKNLTDVDKLSPTSWSDTSPPFPEETTPFPGRTPGTKSTVLNSRIQLTSPPKSPIVTPNKFSYGGVTYTNTSNDDQPPEYSIPIDEYYRKGSYVSNDNPSQNQSIPTSGEISFANFRGGIGGDIVKYITTNRENLQLKTIFAVGEWEDTTRRKRVIIKKGVVIGGTTANPYNFALNVSADLKTGLTLINYGDILGYGGASQGQNGGNALVFAMTPPTTFTHNITKIKHNFTSGMYGVITSLGQNSGLDYLTLSPFNLPYFTTSPQIDLFNVGDTIYYAQSDSIYSTIYNTNKIIAKDTASFTGVISNGSLSSAGDVLSVTGGTAPLVGMSVFLPSAYSYKKHIITASYAQSFNDVTFSGFKILNVLGFISAGSAITGNGVASGTIVTKFNNIVPYSTSYLGTVTNNIFTVSKTPKATIEVGMSLQADAEIYYITAQTSGTTGDTGTYTLNRSAGTGPYNITDVFYATTNKSQTLSSVNINTQSFRLNESSYFGTTEGSILLPTETAMTGIRYTLEKSYSSPSLNSKSNNYMFFTAGGSTPRGFNVTIDSANIVGNNIIAEKSITISGSTASFTSNLGYYTTNPNKFNATWTVSSISSNTNTFFVSSNNINNTYETTNTHGKVSYIEILSTNVPIKILNYGRIWAGGGAGSSGPKSYISSSSKDANTGDIVDGQRNLLASEYSSKTKGNVSGTSPNLPGVTNILAIKVELGIDSGFPGTGGNGAGYNQSKTLGTDGAINQNATRYAYFTTYGSYTYRISFPYLDLIAVPPNVKVHFTFYGWNDGDPMLTTTKNTWKNVYLGPGSTPAPITTNDSYYGGTESTMDIPTYLLGITGTNNEILIGTRISTVNGVTTRTNYAAYHYIKIDNLYTYGNSNTLSFSTKIHSGSYNYVNVAKTNNFYKTSSQTYTNKNMLANLGSNGYLPSLWDISSIPDIGNNTYPYPTDRVRVVTTLDNQYPSKTYDLLFPVSGPGIKGGSGGDFGSDGENLTGATVAAGKKGNYIVNGTSYFVGNIGDVKGGIA